MAGKRQPNFKEERHLCDCSFQPHENSTCQRSQKLHINKFFAQEVLISIAHFKDRGLFIYWVAAMEALGILKAKHICYRFSLRCTEWTIKCSNHCYPAAAAIEKWCKKKKNVAKYKCALRGMNKITFPSFASFFYRFLIAWHSFYIMTPPSLVSIHIPHLHTAPRLTHTHIQKVI